MVKRLGYIVLLAVLLISCEVIREEDRFIPIPTPLSTERTHVLIEYTGFRCVNCPTAAAHAAQLQQTYGEQLIIVAMHPATNPFTQGVAQYDYTCPEADTYYRHMGGTASTAFPTGNINMTTTPNGYLSDYLQWGTLLAQAMQQECDAYISAQALMDTTTRQAEITTTAYADSEKEYQLLIWLTEDSIVGAQAMPDGSVNTHYYHQHVLRATSKDIWGIECLLSPTPTQRTYTLSIPDKCKIEHCHIITLLLNKETKEILNATKTRLTPK